MLRMEGNAKDVILAYMGSFAASQRTGSELTMAEGRLGSGEIRYTKLEYLNTDATPAAVIRSGDRLIVRLHFRASRPVREPSFGLRLSTDMGTLITETNLGLHGVEIGMVEPGERYIDVEIDSLNLVPGRYTWSFWATGRGGNPVYDGDVRAALEVEVADVYKSGRTLDSRLGLVYFPHRWNVSQVLAPPSNRPGHVRA
jgi:lipopolysaccharide transport system ATP-binding protein